MGVQYSNGIVTWPGRPFKYWTFWTINKLFPVQFSDHHLNTGPFDNQAHIYHLITRLVRHSVGYCIRIPTVQGSIIYLLIKQPNKRVHSELIILIWRSWKLNESAVRFVLMMTTYIFSRILLLVSLGRILWTVPRTTKFRRSDRWWRYVERQSVCSRRSSKTRIN